MTRRRVATILRSTPHRARDPCRASSSTANGRRPRRAPPRTSSTRATRPSSRRSTSPTTPTSSERSLPRAARSTPATGPGARSASASRLLNRTADLLERDRDKVARAETLNTGKALRESCWDVDDVIKVFRYYAGLVDKETGRLVATPGKDAVAKIVYEPIGVCGLIGPWNYPLLQMSWKVAPALAAGDTIVMKPASYTPLTTILLTELLEEAGAPQGVVNLVLGPGERVGEALAASPDVDMISLTGGIEAGRRLVLASAGNLKRVALELGGKSPNIVFADADFETAVDNALTAAFVHSGQVCSAGCRLIVQDAIHDRFVEELGRRADRIRLGHGLDPATEAGALISASHREKVERHVAGAVDGGARLVAGGRRARRKPELQAGFFLRPTVFADCTADMAIVREEVFGPVVTVERFSTEEEAIALGNDTTYGLAGAVWTNDASRAQRVAGAPPPRDRLDQRLQRLHAAGRVGRLPPVRPRSRAGPDRPRRVPRGEARLPEHEPRAERLVLGG